MGGFRPAGVGGGRGGGTPGAVVAVGRWAGGDSVVSVDSLGEVEDFRVEGVVAGVVDRDLRPVLPLVFRPPETPARRWASFPRPRDSSTCHASMERPGVFETPS